MNGDGASLHQVYIWGRGGDGQLGHGDSYDQWFPRAVLSLEGTKLTSITCGGKHTAAVTDTGDVFTWGWNCSGQLGHGNLTDQNVPWAVKSLALVKILERQRFVDVAAGNDHTVALTASGAVYAWGAGHDGQLGIGSTAYHLTPTLVFSLHRIKITRVACGSGHTLCLSDNGSIYCWGKGANGRLGLGKVSDVQTPRKLEFFEGARIICIKCGFSHSMCLTDSNVLYTWGKGQDGRLGHGDEKDQWEPKAIEYFIDNRISILSMSGGYFHSAAIADDFQLYTWGFGEYGQLGLNNTQSEFRPQPVESLQGVSVSQVACGGGHTLILDDEGNLYSCGLGDYGQLGLPFADKQPTPDMELEPQHIQGYWRHPRAHNRTGSVSSTKAPAHLRTLSTGGQPVSPMASSVTHSPEQSPIHSRSPSSSSEHISKSPLIDTVATESDPGKECSSNTSSTSTMSTTSSENTSVFHTPYKIPTTSTTTTTTATATKLSSPALSTLSASNVYRILVPTVIDQIQGKRTVLLACGYWHTITYVDALPPPEKPPTSGSYSTLPGTSSDSATRRKTSTSPPNPRMSARLNRTTSNLSSSRTLRTTGGKLGGQSSSFSQHLASLTTTADDENDTKLGQKWGYVIHRIALPQLHMPRQVANLCQRGIPRHLRGAVWHAIIGNQEGINPLLHNIFEKHAREELAQGGETSRMLDVDIPRTFPELGLFNDNGALYQQLVGVLAMFTQYRPDIGYARLLLHLLLHNPCVKVQGMSHVGAMLVMHMEPPEAFESFVNLLCGSVFFQILFSMDLTALVKYLNLYNLLFAENLPDLFERFQQFDMGPNLYLLDWFMTLFAHAVPLAIACRMWDCIIAGGIPMIFRCALGLLHANQEKLLSLNFEGCVRHLKNLLNASLSEDAVLKSIFSIHVSDAALSAFARLEGLEDPPLFVEERYF
ncbi:RCC1/BLIP-II protein [Pelomyxa schiedti]|nr:RCC1/BLIP-II protein [Pelomyxa schiedti]